MCERDIVITTTHGPIKGQQLTTIYDDQYYSFQRVPYAQPPLHDLRFCAPLPAQKWTETLDCTQRAEKPFQFNLVTKQVEGSEDCLYLNVYAKKLQSAKPLPVMVFIYGGGFEKGDPTPELHAPDYFMMRDVVLITIAYRVAALGFLSLTDKECNIAGNAGLKDQVLALKWIKANAANFNGDANNITLFGSSAGGSSAHYMTLTPKAKHLFNKAILMSGTALCPFAITPCKNLAYRLAKANGYDGDNIDAEVLKFLRKLSASDLVRHFMPTKDEMLDDCAFGFGPTVESYETEQCIMTKSPEQLLANCWGNEIPIMLGGVSYEGLLMYARAQITPFLLTELPMHAEHALPFALKNKLLASNKTKAQQLGKNILKLHFEDKPFTLASLLNYCDYISYKFFWYPILRTIRARLQYSSAPTFLYRFDFDSPDFNHQRNKYCGKNSKGVAHVDDLSYLFYHANSWKLSPQSAEYKTIVRMLDICTAFAANSKPTCPELTENWSSLNEAHGMQCLNISEDLQVFELPEMEKLKVWESTCENTQFLNNDK